MNNFPLLPPFCFLVIVPGFLFRFSSLLRWLVLPSFSLLLRSHSASHCLPSPPFRIASRRRRIIPLPEKNGKGTSLRPGKQRVRYNQEKEVDGAPQKTVLGNGKGDSPNGERHR
ncbi:MAG: hypothetical protein D6679_04075 [Candidatus Hydrogenedentota bacterium]|nr:MAG: hypothetical protein D6679_04075 [Candidatus Hydrogenedentota bacterium]